MTEPLRMRRLNPDDIELHLKTQRLGRPLVVFHQTGSTNDRVRQAALAGAAEGLTVFAEAQTAGRGQHGRRWLSPPGLGLWFSLLLRSALQANEYPRLVQAAALATAEALDGYLTTPPLIKWPNDLYVGQAKLAGFLLESASDASWQVLGFGLNVRAAPADLQEGQATWVDRHAAHPPVPRAKLAADILRHFEDWYLGWDANRLEERLLARRWSRQGPAPTQAPGA
ncbi:MAG: biotin--[acetyl-CoA-carboxylase] ligase [Verrucomicrobia bacterium]|nr:biotin--[acetyl-CoA-carboxylase] ligase [Verrucomicrobiota bacterium]